MGNNKIEYFIENRRTKEILGGPKSLDQRPFGRTKDILVCGGRTKTDFKDRGVSPNPNRFYQIFGLDNVKKSLSEKNK